MAGYIGAKQGVTQVDGYNRSEADAEFVQVSGDTMTGALIGTDLTLSGGVYLGGTGAANYLDDYEEGTWTPTLTGSTTSATVSYDDRVGAYTKIGNTVHVLGRVNTSSISGGSGTAIIDGLPFAVVNSQERCGAGVGYISGTTLAAGYSQAGLSPDAGASSMRVVQSGSGVAANVVSITSLVGNTFDVVFTLTYKTTA